MKNAHVFYRTLLFTTLGTIFFIGVAIFASVQAYNQDPNLGMKLAQSLGIEVATGKNFGVVFDAHSKNQHSSQIENRIDFPVPGEMLRLKAVNAEIEVMVGDGDKVVVHSSGTTSGDANSKLLDVHEDAANLTLETPEDLVVDHLSIQVELPKTFRKKISIHTVSGDVVLRNLESQTVDVKMVSGEAHLIGVISEMTTVKAVSAEVEIQNENPSNIKILTVSGDVSLKLKNVNSTGFKLKSGTGEIRNSMTVPPEGKFAVEVTTSSGDIEVSPYK